VSLLYKTDLHALELKLLSDSRFYQYHKDSQGDTEMEKEYFKSLL